MRAGMQQLHRRRNFRGVGYTSPILRNSTSSSANGCINPFLRDGDADAGAVATAAAKGVKPPADWSDTVGMSCAAHMGLYVLLPGAGMLTSVRAKVGVASALTCRSPFSTASRHSLPWREAPPCGHAMMVAPPSIKRLCARCLTNSDIALLVLLHAACTASMVGVAMAAASLLLPPWRGA